MTTIPAAVTEPELSAWLTKNVGEEIANSSHAARLLLAEFDLVTRDGRSVNSHNRTAETIFDPGAARPESWEPFSPVTAGEAAHGLHAAFRITRKPADYQRIITDLPTPVVVSRHQCPFCRRYTRADARQVRDHMTRCWQNPGLRCCKTCVHKNEAGPEDDEACTHADGPEWEDYRFPVLHCPLWQNTAVLPVS